MLRYNSLQIFFLISVFQTLFNINNFRNIVEFNIKTYPLQSLTSRKWFTCSAVGVTSQRFSRFILLVSLCTYFNGSFVWNVCQVFETGSTFLASSSRSCSDYFIHSWTLLQHGIFSFTLHTIFPDNILLFFCDSKAESTFNLIYSRTRNEVGMNDLSFYNLNMLNEFWIKKPNCLFIFNEENKW